MTLVKLWGWMALYLGAGLLKSRRPRPQKVVRWSYTFLSGAEVTLEIVDPLMRAHVLCGMQLLNKQREPRA